MFSICHYLNYLLDKKNPVMFEDIKISGKDMKESDFVSYFKLLGNFKNRNPGRVRLSFSILFVSEILFIFSVKCCN